MFLWSMDPHLRYSVQKHFSCQCISFPNQSEVIAQRLKDWDACHIPSEPNLMSLWNGCWVPLRAAFQQTGGFPVARGEIVPGRGSCVARWEEGKLVRRKKKPQKTTFLNKHEQYGLCCCSQHIAFDLGRVGDWFSFKNTPTSKHHETCNEYTTSKWL